MYRHMSGFVSQYNENHIPTTPLQKIMLSVGSAAVSLFDPQRAGNIRHSNCSVKLGLPYVPDWVHLTWHQFISSLSDISVDSSNGSIIQYIQMHNPK